ncbi:MAG TPA: hypothetical protein VF477_07815, partial [Mycobacterium sp.]
YEQVKETLNRIREGFTEPHEGVVIEYVNPVTGSSAMPTMSFFMQLLRPNETTTFQRSTASNAYCAFEGAGSTEIGDTTFQWGSKDIFVVPKWTWFRHTNNTDNDVYLFWASDEATMRKLELYRSQYRKDSGEVVEVIEDFR